MRHIVTLASRDAAHNFCVGDVLDAMSGLDDGPLIVLAIDRAAGTLTVARATAWRRAWCAARAWLRSLHWHARCWWADLTRRED